MGCISPWRFDSSQPHSEDGPPPAGRRRFRIPVGDRRRLPGRYRLAQAMNLPPVAGSQSLWSRLTVLRCARGRAGAGDSALPRLSADPDPVDGGRIVDSRGREVLLRGVNVNSLGEYWQGTDVDPTLPLERNDPERIAGMGWNVVRLIVSWSRVEPKPGTLQRALPRPGREVDRPLPRPGRLHDRRLPPGRLGSDARGTARTRSARPATEPAFGWDGAPGWATLDEGEPRCFTGAREVNPAVQHRLGELLRRRPRSRRRRHPDPLHADAGPRRRAVRRQPRGRRDRRDERARTPSAPTETAQLGTFYERSLAAIRRGERRGDGFRHLVLFEPSVLWSLIGQGPPPAFDHDRNVVYSPHLYGGSIGGEGPPSQAQFETARAEAAGFGGAPVLTGEWGGDPARATDEPDDYFNVHQALQDEFRIGATLWTWKQSCGDPHAATHGGEPPLPPWNVFEMDCSNGGNEIVGHAPHARPRHPPRLRAPGTGAADESMTWNPAKEVLEASGSGARPDRRADRALAPRATGGDHPSGRTSARRRWPRPSAPASLVTVQATGAALVAAHAATR